MPMVFPRALRCRDDDPVVSVAGAQVEQNVVEWLGGARLLGAT
jgi:hypothetical protein